MVSRFHTTDAQATPDEWQPHRLITARTTAIPSGHSGGTSPRKAQFLKAVSNNAIDGRHQLRRGWPAGTNVSQGKITISAPAETSRSMSLPTAVLNCASPTHDTSRFIALAFSIIIIPITGFWPGRRNTPRHPSTTIVRRRHQPAMRRFHLLAENMGECLKQRQMAKESGPF